MEKPEKKARYVDEMDRLVVGAEPKPPQKVHTEYDPMYGFNVKHVPEPEVDDKYLKEEARYGESGAMFYGGVKKRTEPMHDKNYEPEWGYN